jgi:hypothetical protein
VIPMVWIVIRTAEFVKLHHNFNKI